MDLHPLPISRLILLRMVGSTVGLGTMLIKIPIGLKWLAEEVSNSWTPYLSDDSMWITPVGPRLVHIVRDIRNIPERRIFEAKDLAIHTLRTVASLNLHHSAPLTEAEILWLVSILGNDNLWVRGIKIIDVYNGDRS